MSKAAFVISGAIAAAIISPAMAQDRAVPSSADQSPDPAPVADTGLADIVVTARRRAEPLQSTPLAVSAVSQAQLTQIHASELADIKALVPNLNLERASSNPAGLYVSLRGFGSRSTDPAGEPAVSLNIDGVYVGSNFAQTVNLFDVEAVEVLRGPQGTLFGKNSPAGALSIRTRRPTDQFGGLAQVDYGRFGNLQLRGYVDVPLVADKLTTTMSYFRERSDGYIRNTTLNRDVGGVYTQSIRGGLLAKPTDAVTWYVTAQYDLGKSETSPMRDVATLNREEQRIPTAVYASGSPPLARICNAPSAALCISPPAAPFTTGANFDQVRNDQKSYSVVSDLAIDAGPVGIASVTGYRRGNQISPLDIDGSQFTVLHVVSDSKDRQFSQELRLSSTDGGGLDAGGRLDWLVGAFYYYYEYGQHQAFVSGLPSGGTTTSQTNQEGTTNSFALFAHAGYKLTDRITVSAGIRQTRDRKTHAYRNAAAYAAGTPAVAERNAWNNLSVDATVDWRFAANRMVYFRYAQGYRGGGFNGVPSSAAAAGSFQPETVDSFEVGLKTDWFDRRLRINISAFSNTYNDLQRLLLLSDPASATGFARRTVNAAKATTRGVELELQARPTNALNLRASVGYLDAKYDRYVGNLTGNAADPAVDNRALKFPYTSKWTGEIGGTYEAALGSAGRAILDVGYSYRSSYNLHELNYAFANQPGYGLLSATLTWHDPTDRLSVAVYGQNLTNHHYLVHADTVGGLGVLLVDAMPRNWGISGRVKF